APEDDAAEPTAADGAQAPEADAAEAKPAGIFPDEPFRATQPVPGPVSDLKMPTIEQFTLPSGLTVYLLQQTQLPTVFMSFEFDVGSANDPPNQDGLASVCLDLYSEGTEKLDKIAFAEKQADHAVQIWSPAGVEMSTVNMKALEGQLGPALDLLAELLESPGMRQGDLDRILTKRAADLKQERGTPNGIAQRLFDRLVWGDAHPYGHVVTQADLDAITLDSCKAWVAQLRPGGARLWVVGRLTREQLEKALGERLAGWTGEAPKAQPIPAATPATGRISFVQVDGATQSFVMIGAPGPQRSAADYEATFLMAQILGGSFSSRINMNLREDKGYAYGAFGGFDYQRGGSALQIAASVKDSTTALALLEMAKEMKGMREGGATAEELSREKDGALLGLPAKFATPTDTLSQLKRLAYFGLPLDWYVKYPERLRAADAAAVLAAAKAHLPEGNVDVLVVGDANAKVEGDGGTVMEALKKLADDKVFGDGSLIVLDPDGEPVQGD
ncbi:MAG: insulinase family protein, partial [Deltaproteobacteria bacterium]